MTSTIAHAFDNEADFIAALIVKGKLSEAIAQADTLLAENPADAIALHLKGVAHAKLGDKANAIVCFNRALKFKPDFSNACIDLACVLEETGHTELAIKAYEHLLKITLAGLPMPPAASSANAKKAMLEWFNKGIAFYRKGEFEQALSAYRKALSIQPDSVETLANLGLMLFFMRRYEEAREQLLLCLRLRPGYAEALNTLGNTYKDVGQYSRAIAIYRQAVVSKPDFRHAWINIGKSYYEMRHYNEAIKAYEHTIALDPTYVEALCELTHMYALLCLWDKSDKVNVQMQKIIRGGTQSAEPFMVAVHAPGDLQLLNARHWAIKHYPASKPYDAKVPLPSVARSDGKLRIGYLSSDYHHHATAHLISEMFERHDRSRLEIYAYSYGVDDGSMERSRIMMAVDEFRDIRTIDDRGAADLISEDGIDILVDVKGYTQGHRMSLMALRPAPLQMHYLGFPATLGANFIDYFVADSVVAPEALDTSFSESLIRLPHSYQINDRTRPAPEALSRSAYGLPAKGFVFCDFNNPYKITAPVFAVWMRLLKAVEGSVLWLFETQTQATENLKRAAQEQGVDPSRIITARSVSQAEHLARYRHADLFVDTFPVCSHTTASDALWCGVPVVTMMGESFISRVAGSLLTTLNLSELIAADLAAYEALALNLARDPEKLASLRKYLVDGRMHFPLFDSTATTRALEAAYVHAAKRHQESLPPHPFGIGEDMHIIQPNTAGGKQC